MQRCVVMVHAVVCLICRPLATSALIYFQPFHLDSIISVNIKMYEPTRCIDLITIAVTLVLRHALYLPADKRPEGTRGEGAEERLKHNSSLAKGNLVERKCINTPADRRGSGLWFTEGHGVSAYCF